MPSTSDPYHLDRFLAAQETAYARALGEIRSGKKSSHWIWFIFPQIVGLGSSEINRLYSIKSLDEAKAYLAHPILGARLDECTRAVMRHDDLTAEDIFGALDAMKFGSCMTLFEQAAPDGALFGEAIERFFSGRRDPWTLQKIAR